MLCRNITKISGFVTVILSIGLLSLNCSRVSSNNSASINKTKPENSAQVVSNYGKPQVIGTIKTDEIKESSGVVQSRCNENTLWTHNDSGDGAFVFALDLTGKKLATFRVEGAKNIDWEDIATVKTPAGECFLYIADTGNNSRTRNETAIYKVKEPTITGETDSTAKNPLLTEAAETIKIKYADGNHDAETLMLNAQTGDLYILTKNLDAPSGVYKLSANYKTDFVNTLSKIAEVKVPAVPNGFLTGGDISPDGRRAVVCDYFAAYELEIPAGDKNFEDIWKQKPEKIDLGERRQGEACGYSPDGKSIFATSEKLDSPIIRVIRNA